MDNYWHYSPSIFKLFLSLHHLTIFIMITLLLYIFLKSMLRFLLNIIEKKLNTDFLCYFFWVLENIHGFVAMSVSRIESF
jgi:hypothetical protein